MKVGPKVLLAAKCAPGVTLQLGGLWWALRPGWEEVHLFAALLLVAIGTPLCMVALERHALRVGRRSAWALTALLGPLGPILVGRLRPRARSVSAATTPSTATSSRRSIVDRLVALALTAFVGIGFIWAGLRWLEGQKGPASASTARMQDNEQRAFSRLRTIAQAQERYRQQDWDGDGKKTYAAFYIHLYQSVDVHGDPVPVGLIARELAFAMVPSFALDGYVYKSLHTRAPPGSPDGLAESLALDPEREWGVVAVPSAPGTTAVLPLLAETSGRIWLCRLRSGWASDYLLDLPQPGCVELRSAADLARIQQETKAPE